MAEPKIPLLSDKLTLPERVMLGQMTNHVGFPVLIKLFEAIVERTQQDLARVDPEKDGYEKILAYRQQRYRTTMETTRDVLDAIHYHKEIAGRDAPDAVLESQLQLPQGE